MANKKISELNQLATPVASNDLFVVVDVNAGPAETKNLTMLQLMTSGTTPGTFTNLTSGTISLALGTSINEYSTDVNLTGNSNSAVPTERAVKTYIDNSVSVFGNHNNLLGLQGGDSTSSEYYHLTQAIHDALFSESSTIGLGDGLGTYLKVNSGSDIIELNIGTFANLVADSTGSITLQIESNQRTYIDNEVFEFGDNTGVHYRLDYNNNERHSFYDNINTEQLRIDENGLKLLSGSPVTKFSVDGTLSGNSDSSVPTEKAVKTYVDTSLSLDVINGSEAISAGDSTGVIVFSVAQSDTNYSVVGNLVNESDVSPSIYGHIIKEKTTTGFIVIFSGPMDSANYEFDWLLSRNVI